MELSGSMTNIGVAARIRPPTITLPNINRKETHVDPAVTKISNTMIAIQSNTFNFPFTVITGSNQEHSYSQLCTPILQALAKGANATILAYGQTGSGKTHTLFGPPGSLTSHSIEQCDVHSVPPQWGCMPRLMFDLVNNQNSFGQFSNVLVSAIEVYQDSAYDLLNNRGPLRVGTKSLGRRQVGAANTSAGVFGVGGDILSSGPAIRAKSVTTNVSGVHPSSCHCSPCFIAKKAEKEKRKQLRDSGAFKNGSSSVRKLESTAENGDYTTQGETFLPLRTSDDIVKLCTTVEGSRTAASHNLNERSSRSHALVKLKLTKKNGSSVSIQTMMFVDLAGSERINKSGVEGTKKCQAIAINSSLTILGRVIQRLNKRDNGHIPFRDSILTMLLRSSLEGRAKLCVCINLSSEAAHAEESICSSRFGARLSSVKNLVGESARARSFDASKEFRDITRRKEEISATLVLMESRGEGERFGEEFRSHALVKLKLTKKNGSSVSIQTMMFVDLAGSERINKSGVEGTKKCQAIAINSSLTILGRVIQRLNKRDNGHIPFRDSILTMLLRSSLEGRAKLCVCINLSSEAAHAEESICSSRFGARLSSVKNLVGESARARSFDASKEFRDITRRKEEISATLVLMESRGEGERFGEEFSQSEIRGFVENVAKLSKFSKEVIETQRQLYEASAKNTNSPSTATLQKRLEELKFQETNMNGIISRQKYISGFHIPPKPLFQKLQKELVDIDAQMHSLGGQK